MPKLFSENVREYEQAYYSAGEHVAETTQVVRLLRQFSRKTPVSVLDIGCGSGLHSLELAKRGYCVTGVDISEPMLRAARRRLRGRSATLVRADISRWRPAAEYSAAIALFQVFSYLHRDEELVRALRTVHGCLAPGGVFLFDVVNATWAYRNFEPVYFAEVPRGMMVWKRSLDDSRDILRAEGHFLFPPKRFTDAQRFRIFTGPGLALALKAVGFRSVRLACDWKLTRHTRKSPNLHVVAVK